MKKLSLLTAFVAAIYATSSLALIAPMGSSTALDFAGAVKTETLEKHFINVKNTKGSTVSAGLAVVLDFTADDGASVTTAVTAGQSPICIMVNACANGALCLCQKYGILDTALFDSTAASAVAGSRFYMSTNNAGYISARGTALATEIPGGVFYDAASASGSVQVFINL